MSKSLNAVYLKLLEKFNVWAHAHPAAASVAVIVGPIGLFLAIVALILLGLLVVLVVLELIQLIVLRLLHATRRSVLLSVYLALVYGWSRMKYNWPGWRIC